MKLFTRLSATVGAAVDRAVCGIENHDAVVAAAIGEMRSRAGEARARLNRVSQEAATMRERRDQLSRQAEQWATRAVRPELDEHSALECISRKRQCEVHVAELAQHINKHEALIERLAGNIQRMEQRLAELNRQRTLMRSREAAAEIQRLGEAVLVDSGSCAIDDTLERWEARVAAAEIETAPFEDSDRFERTFVDQEEHTSLAAELAELKRNREA